MPINFRNSFVLKKIAQEIKDSENSERKSVSLKQFEVFMDRMDSYVKRYLTDFYNEEDIKSLPVISSINLCKRIIKQEASIYKRAPMRTFLNVSEEQAKVLEQVYSDMDIDSMLQKSNEYFKLQAQNNIQILPYDGELRIRVLMNHHFDVVPNPEMPEEAEAYILSGFNKRMTIPSVDWKSDGQNQTTADQDDWANGQRVFVLWSETDNFLFNEDGNIIGELSDNPIQTMPFVDISPAKDYEFFVRQGQSVTDFTIQFNAALTDMSQIVRMQGFAQAYMIGPQDMMPTSIKVGPAITVKMPVNPSQPEVRPEFGFAQPNADIDGSMKYLESLVALFLSSRGIDPKTISATGDGKQFTSALERLLSMIEKFEASRSDFSIYEKAEKQIFKIVKAYLNTYSGTDVLKYNIAQLSDAADVKVYFEEPEMLETESEKLAEIEKKLDLGLISTIEAIMEDREISEEMAIEIKKKIITEPSLMEQIANGQLGTAATNTLNGAQVTALVDIITKVAAKALPAASAISVIQSSFGLSRETSEEIVSSAENFNPEYVSATLRKETEVQNKETKVNS